MSMSLHDIGNDHKGHAIVMQYFRYERRAASAAWNAALYPKPPGESLSHFKTGPVHEVADDMTLRDCIKMFPAPDDKQPPATTPPPKPDEPDEPLHVGTGPFTPRPDSGGASVVAYRNYRGEVAVRTVRPLRLWFGSTEYHPEDQWLLDVWDEDKGAERTYALSGFVNPKEVAHVGA